MQINPDFNANRNQFRLMKSGATKRLRRAVEATTTPTRPIAAPTVPWTGSITIADYLSMYVMATMQNLAKPQGGRIVSR
jgi:hypothetical protein